MSKVRSFPFIARVHSGSSSSTPVLAPRPNRGSASPINQGLNFPAVALPAAHSPGKYFFMHRHADLLPGVTESFFSGQDNVRGSVIFPRNSDGTQIDFSPTGFSGSIPFFIDGNILQIDNRNGSGFGGGVSINNPG